jgi:hypothetical protein
MRPEYLNDKIFLKLMDHEIHREQLVKITVLDFQTETAIASIEGKTTSGSCNLSGTSNMRRTGSCSLVVDPMGIEVQGKGRQQYYNIKDVENVISMNKKIKLETGFYNTLASAGYYEDYDIIWYPLGVYVIKAASVTKNTSGLNLSFEGSWDAKITYNKDSAVTYNNSLYSSVGDNNLAHTPSVNSEYWTLVINFNTITAYDNGTSNLSSTTMQDAIDEVNSKINTNTQNINANTTKITQNTQSITDINSRISQIDNTADQDKSVKYATTSNYAASAGTSNKCIGNAETATNADAVDGFHIQVSTTDLETGTSTLTTNVLYLVYE